eukprot:172274_1
MSHIHSIIIGLSFFCSSYIAYLPQTQVTGLIDLYESLNGDKWTVCQWNFTELQTSESISEYYCGLYITSLTHNIQTVWAFVFDYDNNLNGTISKSIQNLVHLQW